MRLLERQRHPPAAALPGELHLAGRGAGRLHPEDRQHPEDHQRLLDDPDVMIFALEEFLRAYAPVTMARRIVEDTEYKGCPIKAGERILMNFPAANRDPEQFPEPDKVILDRENNRHVAFGAGIHRCAGSNLARMQFKAIMQESLARIPEYSIRPDVTLEYTAGIRSIEHGIFMTEECVTEMKERAVSRICIRIAGGRPSIVSRCLSLPSSFSWGFEIMASRRGRCQ